MRRPFIFFQREVSTEWTELAPFSPPPHRLWLNCHGDLAPFLPYFRHFSKDRDSSAGWWRNPAREASLLTWIPKDEAGQNRHVKFSLHFPLNNCSCFAWGGGGGISQIREAKARKEMCLHGGGKMSVTSTSSYWIVWGSFTPVSFCLFP